MPYTGFLRWKWGNRLAVLARVAGWLQAGQLGVGGDVSGRGTGKIKTAGQ